MRISLADWGATERLELGGKAVEGVTVVQTFDRETRRPVIRHFREAYIKRYDPRAPDFGVYAYDATEVMNRAARSKEGKNTLRRRFSHCGNSRVCKGNSAR